MSGGSPIPESQQFTHEAMNTVFSLWLRGVSHADASGIARICWETVDLLESRLSRFVETSDIARVNRLAAGETLFLSEDCHRCLLLGLQAFSETGGLFDITLGTGIEHRKSGSAGPPPEPVGSLIIHPDVPAVTCVEPGRMLDLGGIGKGYALDRVREVLADWGGDDALVAAGASSMLAIGPSRWPVELAGEGESLEVVLSGNSLSASGTLIQGDHIVHPGGDGAMPARPNKNVWAVASTAAAAEVATTAMMLVSEEELADLLACVTGVAAGYSDRGGSVIRVF
jgi:thiamine biosynthesis lipoprotein